MSKRRSQNHDARAAALEALFPGVAFSCVVQQDGWRPLPFQTIHFSGSRAAVGRFAPAEAFGRRFLDWYVDEHGDRWSVHPATDAFNKTTPGRFEGVVHSDGEGTEAPISARRWPQVGLAKRVDRMIRRARIRRREALP